MFDIGFWELVMIAVVALLVVGPDEFPSVIRKVGGWINDVRRFTSSVRSEFNAEIRKAEELKELITKEARVAEIHKVIDETKTVIPVDYEPKESAPQAVTHAAERSAEEDPAGPRAGEGK